MAYKVKASWGGVDIWVRTDGITGQAPRRIVAYEGAYRDGASTEDLGRGPRKETWEILCTPEDFVKLERACDKRQVYLLTHPLFTPFQARLSVQSYKQQKEFISANIEITEHKGQQISAIGDAVKTIEKRAVETAAQWEVFDEAYGEVEDKTDTVESHYDDLSTDWEALNNSIMDVTTGVGTWESVEGNLGAFTDTSDELISALQGMTTSEEAWIAVSELYVLRQMSLDYVTASRADASIATMQLITDEPTDVYTLCAAVYGSYERADDIIQRNGIIDPFYLPAGLSLDIPTSGA